MPVPDYQSLLLPLLKLLADDRVLKLPSATELLANELQLSVEDRNELLQNGQSRLKNRVGWAVKYLREAQLIQRVEVGSFQITDRGHEVLSDPPARIDIAYLEQRFPGSMAFRRRRSAGQDSQQATFDAETGKWSSRPAVNERIERKLVGLNSDEPTRLAVLRFAAFIIENADEEDSSSWYVRETDSGLRLLTGRLFVCEIRPAQIRVSVMGPIDNDVRRRIGADPEHDQEVKFSLVPGGLILSFPVEHATEALNLLRDPINGFIDAAVARIRSVVGLEDHAPEAVWCLGTMIGKDLPQPVPAAETGAESEGDGRSVEDGTTLREPKVRGRAPIFELGQRSIASLTSDIERGVIALPDLQRPFVWEDTKVRDLLDSLFLGFPVGTLVFWHTSSEKEARAFGDDQPGLRATTLVIDGQQRLTSLYAVIKGAQVLSKDGARKTINIAFRPRDGRFEVADAAIRNDPEFLSSVGDLWNGRRLKSQIRRELIGNLKDKGREIDDAYEDAVDRNLDRASELNNFRLPTVDIRKTSSTGDEEVTEEDVAEIFVRINNQGTRLGQADFVLTLLSVFHGELRDKIESRAREMSKGTVVAIDTQQLLRAVCGVAFGRARMSAVYRYLRGVDPVTGEADPAERVQRLKQLDDAADQCMDLTPWRDFLLRVQHAGFVSPRLIASKNAIVNAYAFYIRGRTSGVSKRQLDDLIARWVFGTLLTARYSGSSETMFEQDLARVTRLGSNDAEGFIRALDDALGESLTGDYWTHTLVASLETQKARAPAALAFRAAQVVLGSRALFSDQRLQHFFSPPAQAGRSAGEAHHLFPDAWLSARGIRDRREINQVANLADTGWHENSMIGARGPADYVPRLREKLGLNDDEWRRQCAEHALPPGWEQMEYGEFLRERRIRMADIIRVAFRQLGGESESSTLTPPWFLPGSEDVWKEIAGAEKALRRAVGEVYVARFAHGAAQKVEESLSEPERLNLTRALRSRPVGADPLSVLDYLYIGQLPPLLFANIVWDDVRIRFGWDKDTKHRVNSAVSQIAPVRNEIAHVREVERERLLRASVACSELERLLDAGDP